MDLRETRNQWLQCGYTFVWVWPSVWHFRVIILRKTSFLNSVEMREVQRDLHQQPAGKHHFHWLPICYRQAKWDLWENSTDSVERNTTLKTQEEQISKVDRLKQTEENWVSTVGWAKACALVSFLAEVTTWQKATSVSSSWWGRHGSWSMELLTTLQDTETDE